MKRPALMTVHLLGAMLTDTHKQGTAVTSFMSSPQQVHTAMCAKQYQSSVWHSILCSLLSKLQLVTALQSPLQPRWNRVLQIGDASGIQSPLSFGGFGAMTRHLARLRQAVIEALEVLFSLLSVLTGCPQFHSMQSLDRVKRCPSLLHGH